MTSANAEQTSEETTTGVDPDASRHVTAVIPRPWKVVYEFAADPRNLPRWAAGLAGGEVQREVEQWSMPSPMGKVLVSFVPENPYGVLDHTVTLPSGESVLNPMRVLPLTEETCEVVFTLRRGSMSEDEFEADAAAVAADLAELRDQVTAADGADTEHPGTDEG